MREIKFRAWDAEYNIFLYYDLLAYHTEVLMFYKKPVMQYTGLKDKNGVDIYEGDIIKDETVNTTYAIYWDLENSGWANSSMYGEYHLVKSLEKSLEAVGNIYENPELI